MPRKPAQKTPEPKKTVRVSLKSPADRAIEKTEYWKNAYLSAMGGASANPEYVILNKKEYDPQATAALVDIYARAAAMRAVYAFDQVVLEKFDEEEEE